MRGAVWHYDGKLAIGGQVYQLGRVKGGKTVYRTGLVKARKRQDVIACLRAAHDKGPEAGRAALLDVLEGVTNAPRSVLESLETRQLGRICCLAMDVELDCDIF